MNFSSAIPSSDKLRFLIKSMSKPEKRHFKLFAQFYQGNKESNAIALFDAINSLETYNEEKLAQVLPLPKLLNNLATHRYQLQGLLLRSLGTYHLEKSAPRTIRQQLEGALIYRQKGIYAAASKLLRSAQKRAQSLKDLNLELQIIQEQRPLALKWDAWGSIADLDALFHREKEILEALQIRIELQQLMDKVTLFSQRKLRKSTEEQADLMQQVTQHERLQDPPPEDFFAALAYHELWGKILLVKGEYASAMDHSHCIMELWNESKTLKEAHPIIFARHLTHLLNLQIMLQDDKGSLASIQMMEQVKTTTREAELQKIKLFSYLQLIFYLNTGQLDSVSEIIPEIDRLVDIYQSELHVNQILAFQFNICIFFFITGDFSNALDRCNFILNMESLGRREDIRDFLNAFQLILHFELENFDLLEYLNRSTHRYFKHKPGAHDYEVSILKFVKESLHIEESSQQELLELFQKELQPLSESQERRKPLGIFELLFWIESRLRKIPIRSVFEEKLNSRTPP